MTEPWVSLDTEIWDYDIYMIFMTVSFGILLEIWVLRGSL